MNHVFTFSAKAIEIKSKLWQPNSQKNHDVCKKRQTNKETLENYAVFASSPIERSSITTPYYQLSIFQGSK